MQLNGQPKTSPTSLIDSVRHDKSFYWIFSWELAELAWNAFRSRYPFQQCLSEVESKDSPSMLAANLSLHPGVPAALSRNKESEPPSWISMCSLPLVWAKFS